MKEKPEQKISKRISFSLLVLHHRLSWKYLKVQSKKFRVLKNVILNDVPDLTFGVSQFSEKRIITKRDDCGNNIVNKTIHSGLCSIEKVLFGDNGAFLKIRELSSVLFVIHRA